VGIFIVVVFPAGAWFAADLAVEL